MSGTTAPLFQLLPAIYRIRDAAQGGQLQTLMAIFQDVLDSLDRDVEGMYENWFIETCAEWVVPYIGDLLQSRPLYAASTDTFSTRAYVANTLSYRRRKGTPIVLEQLAADVTGWPARSVEFFQLLGCTQYLNHLRPQNLITPDLRDTATLGLLESAFDSISHTADLRGIVDSPIDPALVTAQTGPGAVRGKYGLQNIGLFLWRLSSYPMTRTTPRPLTDGTDGRYLFNPLGRDAPLFNPPQTLPAFSQLAREINVPAPLRRRALYDELEARRQAMVDAKAIWLPGTQFALGATIVDSAGNTERVVKAGTSAATPPAWPGVVHGEVSDGSITWQLAGFGFETGNEAYFAADPVLQVALAPATPYGAPQPIPPEQIMICDLSDLPPPAAAHSWRPPPASKTYRRASDGLAVSMPIKLSIDPLLGRLAFPATGLPAQPASLTVGAAYGFSGDYGGGPYNRAASVTPLLAGVTPWQVAVTQELAPVAGQIFATLTSAVQAWNALAAGRFGVIALLDSRSYTETLAAASQITIPQGSTLLILAADWPSLRLPGSAASTTLSPDAVRPHLRGNLSVLGTAPAGSANPGSLILNGLLIEGQVAVQPGNLGSLQVMHCTLLPSAGGLAAGAGNVDFSLALTRSICGPVVLDASAPALSLTDSIVDGGSGQAISAPGADATVQSSTVFGTIGAAQAPGLRSLQASNSIFAGLVTVERTQAGCMRFSVAPQPGARMPRRYRCQPDLALAATSDPTAQMQLRAELTPLFTSTTYGDPGYAQLSQGCAAAIRAGADNGAEMGAFYALNQPQRDTNLRSALPEYLRFGLQAGIFYVT